MKIGIDARMYGSGFTGIGRYNFELIQRLSELDTHHHYIIFLRKEGFEAFTPPNQRFTKVLADFPHYSLSEQTQFLSLLNSFQLDLMHFTHFNAPIFYRRPYVVTIHDLTLSFFPGKKMNRWFYRMAYHIVLSRVTRRAKMIIAVSKHTQKDLQKVLKISDSRIVVIYNGVNPEFSEPAAITAQDLSKKFHLERPYFLYTGVWRDHKNLVGLIKAFKQFNATDHGHDLVITGKFNPIYEEVVETVKTLKLKDHVHLVGLVSEDDLKALYQHAFAYAFPSFYEGFGLPPLEAMQCGTPVLASNASSIPEVCGEGNALFFDPYQTDDIAQKMQTLVDDPPLRQQLIQRGLERVKQFSWTTMAKKVLSLYNQF
ncbi:glycosyltransferase family 4 protein [Candidatus Peregrinibacteria bacterium]|nr:MAG: glycosyltransferase family 4 protein [Candidatus Peregrinibacteria bacterium]